MSDLLVVLLVTVLAIAWAPLACAVLYLLCLTVAAAAPRQELPRARRQRTFRVVIPAHNEELVLEPVLRRLMDVRYPRANFDVVVIADNCSDGTAEVAHAWGARVLERFDPTARGKGRALAYAFTALRAECFDAYVILDADTLVDPDLLTVFNRYLEMGHRIMQAHYDVLNPFETQRTALMHVAFRIFNYVRPLGRRRLGLSTGLKGNGMCFAKSVIERYPWNAFSLAEDIEYTTTLLLNGEQIVFAPEAQVWAQMPTGRVQGTTQRMRWEGGRLQLARRDGPRLVLQGLRRFDPIIFDWGMDLVIPPLAVLTLMIMNGLAIAAPQHWVRTDRMRIQDQ
jgi:1,2-diacylglycerol 3-beta-glucosyltransferase